MESVYFMVYSSRDKHPEQGTIIECPLIKELNITFLSKSVINSAALISYFYNRLGKKEKNQGKKKKKEKPYTY